jgi:hypothetical protein
MFHILFYLTCCFIGCIVRRREITVKRKALLLLMGLTIPLLMMALPVQAIDLDPHLYLDPAATVGPPPSIGETLTLTLRVDQVTHLVAWCVSVEWDPSKLELLDWAEGGCLKASGVTTFCIYEGILPGKIDKLSCTTLPLTPVDVPPAPDDLASFDFKVLNYTCCMGTWINLTYTELDYDETTEIPHTFANAKFTLCRPPIYSCYQDGTATDEYMPSEIIYVAIYSACGCEWVTIYVVPDQPRWEPCMMPQDVTDDGANFVHLKAGWNYIPLGTIPGAEPCNYYDIWVDVNNNEHYDKCEPVDDIEVPGFHIIPELASTLMGLGACLVALGTFAYKRFQKN